MMSNNIPRVFVKADNTATINCPQCQLAKTVAVDKFRTTRHTIIARCTCGHSFPVSLDFRTYYRKKIELPGTYATRTPEIDDKHLKETKLKGGYSLQESAAGYGHMMITNLSCGGLQFTTSGNHVIEVGQQAQLTFTLDDRKNSQISKRVIVQSVTGNIIGCRFAGNAPLEQALRFYLFP